MKLNADQQKAVERIDRNIALVAGAGTGKTAVLTERFLRILKEGDLPAGKELISIAAITFTEKAAEEMKARIQNRIRDERKNLPNLIGQTELNISTIHGFCARLLRNDPVTAGVDPAFVILTDPDAQTLMLDALSESYREISAAGYEAVILRHEWHEHGAFLSDVLELDRQLRAANAPIARVREESLRTPERTESSDEALLTLLFDTLPAVSKSARLYKFFSDESLRIKLNGSPEIRDELYRQMMEADACGGKQTVALKEALMHYLAAHTLEYTDSYEFLFDLLEDARIRYQKKKENLAALDYDDLQEKVLLLLADEDKRRTLQDEIRYLMVDEAQDINDLQARIFYGICSRERMLDRRNLFVVGDPRQSIYGFRYARAELFEQLQEDIRDSGGDVLSMQINYRCSRQIIDYVNGVFRTHFPEADELQAGASAESVCIEWCGSQEDEEPDAETDAERVRDKILEMTVDGVRYDEIALLFRASTKMQLYENKLKQAGIPCINLSSGSFWNRQEVLDLLAAALVATGQADDIGWLAFLRSPLAGLSDRELLSFRSSGANWEEHLMAKKYDHPTAQAVLQKVRTMRAFVRTNSLSALTETLRSTYDIFCAGEPDAERRLANLDRLSEWLHAQEETLNPSPEALAGHWLKQTRRMEEEGKQAVSDRGSVELMTVHKAKGLEKRIIFLIGTDAPPNYSTGPILYEDEKVSLRTTARYALARSRRLEREAREELRILYVALTRAIESLYLTEHTGKAQNFFAMLKDADHDPYGLPKMQIRPVAGVTREKPHVTDHPEPVLIPEVHPQNRAYSASQLMTFQHCKREWYLRYVLGLPEEISGETVSDDYERADDEEYRLTGVQKGSLFHTLAEMDDGSPVDALIRRARLGNRQPLTEKETKQLADWLGYVRAYPYQGRRIHELTFDWLKNGVLWTGSIDLTEEGDTVRIYDFKTNDSVESLLEKYEIQMQIYALAYHALYGVVPASYLWWLPGNRLLEADVSEKALLAAAAQMDAFAAYVGTKKEAGDYPCMEACTKGCRMRYACDLTRHI